jgi:hypothetical protein
MLCLRTDLLTVYVIRSQPQCHHCPAGYHLQFYEVILTVLQRPILSCDGTCHLFDDSLGLANSPRGLLSPLLRMLLMMISPPLCIGSRTMACSLSSISSLTPTDQPCFHPILSISSLPLAMADRRALMFVPVRSSSPSLADLIRPSPRASTRHTRGRNSDDLSCSSTSSSLRLGVRVFFLLLYWPQCPKGTVSGTVPLLL